MLKDVLENLKVLTTAWDNEISYSLAGLTTGHPKKEMQTKRSRVSSTRI